MMERLLDGWDVARRHPPWDWPQRARWMGWLCCVVLGALMASPVWLADWDAWQAQRAAHAQQRMQQQALAQWRRQTAALQQRLQPPGRAATRGLLALHDGMDAASDVTVQWRGLEGPAAAPFLSPEPPAASAMRAPLAGVPVRFWTARVQMDDRFLHWLIWWQQLNRGAPGGRIVALDMQALNDDRVRVRLTVSQPLLVDIDRGDGADAGEGGRAPDHEAHATKASPHDPFDHRAPSPDVMAHQQLEREALAQLRYVGRLRANGRDQVLLRAPGGRDVDAVQAVSVGDGLGPSLGRLGAASDAAVQIDGAWQDARGVWRAQSVRLDFAGAAP